MLAGSRRWRSILECGPPTALNTLLPSVCRLALVLLLAASASAQQARKLARQIEDAREEAQPAWFQQLAAIGDEEALNLLIEIAEDIKGVSRRTFPAFRAFLHFRDRNELETVALEFLRQTALSSTSYPSMAAVNTLAQWGPAANQALTEVVHEASLANSRARAITPLLPVIRENPDAANLDLLLEVFRSPLSGPPEKFAQTLTAFPSELLVPRLQEWFQEEVPPALLDGAMRALTSTPGEEAGTFLVELLEHENPALVLRALHGLRQRGDGSHEAQLVSLMRSKDPVLRYFALVENGRLHSGDPKWEKKLLKMASSKDRIDRQAAAACAGLLPQALGWSMLKDLLVDEHRTVRSQALVSTGLLRRRDSIPFLIERVAEEGAEDNPVMRDRVIEVLAGLTGQTFGLAIHTWQVWWENEGGSFEIPSAEELLRKTEEREKRRSQNLTAGSFYGLPVVSRRAVFVLDVSGSMKTAAANDRYGGGSKATRLDVAKEQMKQALEAFPRDGLFNMVFFHTSVKSWQEGLVRMNKNTRAKSLKFLERQRVAGATALYDALEAAFRNEGVDTIYLMSDGIPGGGTINNPQQIRKRVQEWNAVAHATIHCVSVGGEIQLLRWLAEDSGGRFQVVKPRAAGK